MVPAQSSFWKILDFFKAALIFPYTFVPKIFCVTDIKLKLIAVVRNYCLFKNTKFGDSMWSFSGPRPGGVLEIMGFCKAYPDVVSSLKFFA